MTGYNNSVLTLIVEDTGTGMTEEAVSYTHLQSLYRIILFQGDFPAHQIGTCISGGNCQKRTQIFLSRLMLMSMVAIVMAGLTVAWSLF